LLGDDSTEPLAANRSRRILSSKILRYYRSDPDQRPTKNTVSLVLSVIAAGLLFLSLLYALYVAFIFIEAFSGALSTAASEK
jgi:hypothetical protein